MKIFFLYLFLCISLSAFCRAGSGGHGSSGGGHFGGGYHGYYGGSSHTQSRPLTPGEFKTLLICFFSVLAALLSYAVYITYLYRNKGKINKKKLQSRFQSDKFWDYNNIMLHAKTLYLELQRAWSIGDLASVKEKLSPRLYRNYSGILNRYKKRGLYNIVEDIDIKETSVIYFDDYIDNSKDAVAILISGELKDYFSKSGRDLSITKKPFKDAYVFIRRNNELILDEILNEPDYYQITKPSNYIEPNKV